MQTAFIDGNYFPWLCGLFQFTSSSLPIRIPTIDSMFVPFSGNRITAIPFRRSSLVVMFSMLVHLPASHVNVGYSHYYPVLFLFAFPGLTRCLSHSHGITITAIPLQWSSLVVMFSMLKTFTTLVQRMCQLIFDLFMSNMNQFQ